MSMSAPAPDSLFTPGSSLRAVTEAADDAALASAIESILLVAAEPVSIRTLSQLLDVDRRRVDSSVDFLMAGFHGRGIRLQLHCGRLQLVTSPENAAIVREFLKLPRQPRLSRASLETLAIIAYRQPVTRAEIEQIRGVSVERVVGTLMARGVIHEAGRRDSPGRPIEYSTTDDFLELFGLSSIHDLPETEHSATQTAFTALGMVDSTASGT